MTTFLLSCLIWLVAALAGYVVGWAQCDAKWRAHSKPHRDGANPEPVDYWPTYQPLSDTTKTQNQTLVTNNQGNHQNDGH